MSLDRQKDLKQVSTALAGAFGIRKDNSTGVRTFSRTDSDNIALFAGNGVNKTEGLCLQRLNFVTAKIMLNQNGITGENEELDKLLRRGVKLRDGKVLRDIQSKNSIPTKYSD